MIKKLIRRIHLGTILKWVIEIISLGTGKYIAQWIAIDLFNFKTCGCCERTEWINRLTDKDFNGNCGDIKLY